MNTPATRLRSNSLSSLQQLLAVLLGTLAAAGTLAGAQDTVPAVTGNARVDKLLSQMSLDDKIAIIRGASEDPATNQGQAGYLRGVPRLGIPAIRMSDGPPGVLTRLPSQGETATMGLAATFSVKDAHDNGVVIGREAKSLGIDVVLEPYINIDRDITFDRAYNTYGEDPVLTGAMGAGLIKGIQGEGVMAQAKHYVAYDTDGHNVVVDPQTLHEVYVAPFVDAVNADVSSIMCSYNKVNGTYACGNSNTLIKILREELGFKGFVTSDWGATHAPRLSFTDSTWRCLGRGRKTARWARCSSRFSQPKSRNRLPPRSRTRLCSRDFRVETCPKSLVPSQETSLHSAQVKIRESISGRCCNLAN